jgi:DNA-binding beta-propeller fold protein YncE
VALLRARMRAVLPALFFLVLCAPAQAKVGDLWLADPQPECPGGPGGEDTGFVYSVNPTTHLIGLLTAGGNLRKPMDVAASPDGNTVWVADMDAFDPTPASGTCDDGNGGVIAVDTTTGTQTIVSSDPDPGAVWSNPRSIAYDSAHRRLVVLDAGTTGAKIYGLDPVTKQQTLLVDSGLATPQAIAVAADGTIYVVDATANGGGPVVSKVVEAGSPPYSMDPVATGPNMGLPRDLAFAANGDLLVFDESLSTSHPGFVRVNLHDNPPPAASANAVEVGPTGTTSPAQLCDTSTAVTMAPYNHPQSLASDPSGTKFYAFDSGPIDPQWCPTPASGIAPTDGLIFSIDPTNAAATWAAGGVTPRPWISPEGLTVAYNRKPIARGPVIEPAAFVGEVVSIDASRSSDPDGDPLTYLFKLDGDKPIAPAGPGSLVATAFNTAGDYVVGVEVSDPNGGVDATTTTVHVLAKPPTPTKDPVVTPPQDDPAPPTGTPTITATLPDGTTTQIPLTVTLQQLLSPSGVAIPLTCTSDCVVIGTLQISLKDFKNLTAAAKLLTLGKGSLSIKAGKTGKLKIKLTKAARKKLKIALSSAHISARRKIKLSLTLQSKYKSGKKKTIRRKIVLKG